MQQKLLSLADENTIKIGVEFLEDGHLLKTGRTELHRYVLDLIVRDDITLNQLLGAVYTGIRDVLTEKFHLDLTDSIAEIVFQDLQDPFAYRAADDRRGERRLRMDAARDARLRISAMRYRHQRQKLAEMDRRYQMPEVDLTRLTPAEKERMGWIVCWQVFHECFRAFVDGYPDSQGQASESEERSEEFRCHPVIARTGVDLRNEPDGAHLGTAGRPQLHLEEARHGSLTLKQLGFMTSSRLIFDPVLWHHSGALYDERSLQPGMAENIPHYPLSNNPYTSPENCDICVRPPIDPPQMPRTDLPVMVLSPLVSTGAFLGICAVTGDIQPDNVIMLSGVMALSAATMGLLGRQVSQYFYKRALYTWATAYKQYIRTTIGDIDERQKQDIALMKAVYPPVFDPDHGDDLIQRTLHVRGDMYCRRPEHLDFLSVRLGTSAAGSCLVPSLFQIQGEPGSSPLSSVRYKNIRNRRLDSFELILADPRKGTVAAGREEADDYLENLPNAIAREYAYLPHAPVLLDLKTTTALGLVLKDTYVPFVPFLSNFIFDLCYHQVPEDLQFVMLCPSTEGWKEREKRIRRYKYLPHFGKLLQDRSAFAFSKKEAWTIFDRLAEERAKDDPNRPHIVVIMEEEYDFRDHPLAKCLPTCLRDMEQDQKITFLFCKRDERELPPYCANVIWSDAKDSWFLLPYSQRIDRTADPADLKAWGQYAFHPDSIIHTDPDPDQRSARERFLRAFKLISAQYHQKHAKNTIPTYLDLFDMMTAKHDATFKRPMFDSTFKRKSAQVLHSELDRFVRARWKLTPGTSVSVPIGIGSGGIVELDLDDGMDGPHLLIAGGKSSGKTETALTYLLSLCAHFAPQYAAILPVDLIKRRLVQAISHLPHVMTAPEAREQSVEAVQQCMTDVMQMLEHEISRRKLLLGRIQAGTVLGTGQLREVPRLFIVIEDYEDLVHIASTAGNMDLHDRMARIMESSRELGIHIILTSGDTGHFPAQLMDAFSSRLCLRLSDSHHQDLTVHDSPVLNRLGRACLSVRNQSYEEYFQVAYSGADICGSKYAPFDVTLARAGGAYERFFDSASYIPPDDDVIDSYFAAAFEPVEYGRGTKDGHGDERQGDYYSGDDDERPDVYDSGDGDAFEDDYRPGRDNAPQGDYRPERDSTSQVDYRPERERTRQGDYRPERDNTSQVDYRPERERTLQGDYRPEEDSAPWRAHGNADRYGNGRAYRSAAGSDRRRQSGVFEDENLLRRFLRSFRMREWKERYFRKWKMHRYHYVPPIGSESDVGYGSGRRVRPDEALIQPAPVGISQSESLVQVIRERYTGSQGTHPSIPVGAL